MESAGASRGTLRPEVRSFMIHPANADDVTAAVGPALGWGEDSPGTPLLNANGMLCPILGPGLAPASGHRRLPVPLGWPEAQEGLTGPGLRGVPDWSPAKKSAALVARVSSAGMAGPRPSSHSLNSTVLAWTPFLGPTRCWFPAASHFTTLAWQDSNPGSSPLTFRPRSRPGPQHSRPSDKVP